MPRIVIVILTFILTMMIAIQIFPAFSLVTDLVKCQIRNYSNVQTNEMLKHAVELRSPSKGTNQAYSS
jgi:hypothetical protein